jgi:chemotaxis response regulator CheB
LGVTEWESRESFWPTIIFLVAEAISRLLEPQFEVIGTASDGRALLGKAQQLKPDVICLTRSMPVLNGFEAGTLKENTAAVKIDRF